jgi:hypothetical protein
MSNIADVSRVERTEANSTTVTEVIAAPDMQDSSAPLEAGPPANDTGPVAAPLDKSAAAARRPRRPDDPEQAKRSFMTIMDEADVAMRVFDQEKRRILGITYALSQIEQSFGRLNAKFEELEKRVEVFAASDNELRARFESSIESIRTRDDREAELLKNNFSLRAALANVERQLGQQADDVRALVGDNTALLQKIAAMEYDTGLILDEIGHLRDDITVLSSGELAASALTPAIPPPPKPVAAPASTRSIETRRVDTAPAVPPRREPEPEVVDAGGIDSVVGDISTSIAYHMNEAALLRARIENLRHASEAAASPVSAPESPRPGPVSKDAAHDQELTELKSLLKSYQEVIRDLDLSRGALIRQAESTNIAPSQVVPAAAASPASPASPASRSDVGGATHRTGPLPGNGAGGTDLTGELQRERQERWLAEGALRTARQERAQLQRELARIRAASSRVMQAEADLAVTRPQPGE